MMGVRMREVLGALAIIVIEIIVLQLYQLGRSGDPVDPWIFLVLLVLVIPIPLLVREPQVRFQHVQVRPGSRTAKPARGMILCVPAYERFGDRFTPEERRAAIEAARSRDGDYFKGFEGTNYAQIVEAVKAQADSLEYLWLIWTAAEEDAPDTQALMLALVAHLRTFTEKLEVNLRRLEVPTSDGQLVEDGCAIVREIQGEARKKGLRRRDDLVCFISAGFRSLALGMTLASLDGRRRIQMTAVEYDAAGLPDFSKNHQVMVSFRVRFSRDDG